MHLLGNTKTYKCSGVLIVLFLYHERNGFEKKGNLLITCRSRKRKYRETHRQSQTCLNQTHCIHRKQLPSLLHPNHKVVGRIKSHLTQPTEQTKSFRQKSRRCLPGIQPPFRPSFAVKLERGWRCLERRLQ